MSKDINVFFLLRDEKSICLNTHIVACHFEFNTELDSAWRWTILQTAVVFVSEVKVSDWKKIVRKIARQKGLKLFRSLKIWHSFVEFSSQFESFTEIYDFSLKKTLPSLPWKQEEWGWLKKFQSLTEQLVPWKVKTTTAKSTTILPTIFLFCFRRKLSNRLCLLDNECNLCGVV